MRAFEESLLTTQGARASSGSHSSAAMPRPKNRRPAGGVASLPGGGASSCLCGQADKWCTAPPVRLVTELSSMQQFYSSLKPTAKENVVKAPINEILPQVVDGVELGLENGQAAALSRCSNEELMTAIRDFFIQILGGACELLPNGYSLPGIKLSDDLLWLACRLTDASFEARFGAPVESGRVVAPTNQGLVSFPMHSPGPTTPGGVPVWKDAAMNAICRPEHEVHFRPWVDPQEASLYKDMLDCCRLILAVLVVLQRRLHKAMKHAGVVRKLVAAGMTAKPDPQTTFQTWSWGLGPAGQLGLGATASQAEPAAIPALSGEQVVQLVAASAHAFARLADGRVVSWGDGNYGVTGHHEVEVQRVPLPCSVQPLGQEGLVRPASLVASGDLHSMLVMGGRIHAWGVAWLGQLGNTELLMGAGCLLPFDDDQHQQLSGFTPSITVSSEYMQALLPPGTVLTPEEQEQRHPMCLSMLSANPVMHAPTVTPDGHGMRPGPVFSGVVHAAAGGVHSAAVTADGSVWVWGCNEAGALAIELPDDVVQQPWVQAMGCACCDGKDVTVVSVSAPVKVALGHLIQGKVVEVAAGSSITLVRTDQGEVVSWGAAHYPPTRVDTKFEQGETGALVTAGGPYGLAVTRESGHVYTWTRDHIAEWDVTPDKRFVSQTLQSWQPRRVPFLEGVTHAACSATHGLAATRDGRVFWWQHAALTPGFPGGANHNFEVAGLRGLNVLSVAVGDSFALVSTGPPNQEADTSAERETSQE